MPTLDEALKEAIAARWDGRRCEKTNESQARKALEAVAMQALGIRRLPSHDFLHEVSVEAITKTHIRAAVKLWAAEGLAQGTIHKRLCCLSVTGIDVKGCYTAKPRTLKWWLKPHDEAHLAAWMDARKEAGRATDNELITWDLVCWALRTGLRVEESLRLTRKDCFKRPDGKWSITVPGKKTNDSQATIPISQEAAAILERRMVQATGRLVFPISYDLARRCWQVFRGEIGALDEPGATLKACRRNAARTLHVSNGMPLDMVRQYLRHENVETTLGYLRLTGGYGEEEMRSWLR